jgi:hypothetical protein
LPSPQPRKIDGLPAALFFHPIFVVIYPCLTLLSKLRL